MKPLKILNKKEKKEVENKLKDQFGVGNVLGEKLMSSKTKIAVSAATEYFAER